MQSQLLSIAAAIGIGLACTATASAADLGTPPLLSPTPVYNWNGLYVGGHLGYARETSAITEQALSPTFVESASPTAQSVLGGGQVGFNWVIVPHVVIGFEWDISGAGLNANATTAFGGGGLVGWTDSINVFGTARGRLGYAFDNWLLYGTGGFAWARESLTRTQQAAGPISPPLNASFSAHAMKTGWSAGAGVEWGFAPNWNARLEYLYVSLDPDDFSYMTASPVAQRGFNITESFNMHVVRVGVNYKFDWGPNAP